jgi:hypothetical protein
MRLIRGTHKGDNRFDYVTFDLLLEADKTIIQNNPIVHEWIPLEGWLYPVKVNGKLAKAIIFSIPELYQKYFDAYYEQRLSHVGK